MGEICCKLSTLPPSIPCSTSNCGVCTETECSKTNGGCFWAEDNHCRPIESKPNPCTKRTYSDWSKCIDGQKTRTHTGYLPENCRLKDGKPSGGVILSEFCCEPNTHSCDGRNLMICKPDGSGKELFKECGIDQTCNATTKTCDQKVNNTCSVTNCGACEREDCLDFDDACSWNFSSQHCQQKIKVTGLTLSTDSLNLTVDETKSVSVTVLPNTASNKSVTWKSNMGPVATVDSKGNVKGINPGRTTITVIANGNPSLKKEISVTVTKDEKASSCTTKNGVTVAQGKYICDTSDGNKRKMCAFTSVSDLTLILKNSPCKLDEVCKNGECIPSCKNKGGSCVKINPATCREEGGNVIPQTDCVSGELCCKFSSSSTCDPNKDNNGDKVVNSIDALMCGANNTCSVTNCGACEREDCLDFDDACFWNFSNQHCQQIDKDDCNNNGGVCRPVCNALEHQYGTQKGEIAGNSISICKPGYCCKLNEGVGGMCNPKYHLQTLKAPPPDSEACSIGDVSWVNQTATEGVYKWKCLVINQGIDDICEASKEKGKFGLECQTNADCQINGLSRCVNRHCMVPGGCIKDIDGTSKWWQGSICVNNRQYTCNNTKNSSDGDFTDTTDTDCPLGCDSRGYKCLTEGFKCSKCAGILDIFSLFPWNCSKYYRDGKEIESINCDYGCDQVTGICKPDPNSTSKTPLCDAAKGTCFGNFSTCREILGGVVVTQTDCPSPQVCCKVKEEKSDCFSTKNRKYLNGQSACVEDMDYDIEGARPGDWLVKCDKGSLTQTLCVNGCRQGICLKGKNESCRFNFECETNVCGPGGMCMLVSEGNFCTNNNQCLSGSCRLNICMKEGSECTPQFLFDGVSYGCGSGQKCRVISGKYKCITDGKCGIADQKDGRFFPPGNPPAEMNGLCEFGTASSVVSNEKQFSWDCYDHDDEKNSVKDHCTANIKPGCSGGASVGDIRCMTDKLYEVCSEEYGWRTPGGAKECEPFTECVANMCRPMDSNTKQGSYCNVLFPCPAELICKDNICKTLKEINLEAAKFSECKSVSYTSGYGTITGEIYSCDTGFSCNQSFNPPRCQPNKGTIRYLTGGEPCENDLQCISGFCALRENTTSSFRLCFDADQKTIIDRQNSMVDGAINTAAMVATFAVAGPAVGAFLQSHPALAAALTVFGDGADAVDIVLSVSNCLSDATRIRCGELLAKFANPIYAMGLLSDFNDVVRASGKIAGTISDAKKALDTVGDAAKAANVVGKVGDEVADEPIKWLEDYFKRDKYKVAEAAADVGEIGDGVSDDTLDLWEILKGEPKLVNGPADVAVAARKVGDEVSDVAVAARKVGDEVSGMAGDVGKVGDEVADIPWSSSKYSVLPDIKLLKEEVADVAIAARKVGDEMTGLATDVKKYSVDLSKTPGVPGSTKVDPAKLQVYLNSITDSDKRAALEILAKGVMKEHITHDQFIDTLNNITNPSVNRIIGNNKYVLVVDSDKSNKWVAELSMPSLLPKPEEVFERRGFEPILPTTRFLIDNPSVKTAVFFDDAIYSGDQLSGHAKSLHINAEKYGIKDLQIIIAVPYATTIGESKLLGIPGVILADHKVIPTAAEVFTKMEQNKLSTLYLGNFDKTVTTFDHKVADSVSTLFLQERYLKSVGGFIPNPIVPYKPGAIH